MSQTTYQTTCLERIIALSAGCDPVVPTSGRYGSDIGMSEDFISQVYTKAYSSPLAFWNEKKTFAIANISNAIHSAMGPKYKAASLLKNFRVGHANDNKVLINGSANLKGVYYDLCNSSSYIDLQVNELSLFTDYSGDITVYVYDLLQNKVIDTITVTSVAGQISTVYPAKTYKSNMKQLSLFFGYDATTINSYKTTIIKGCTDCSGVNYISNNYQKIQAGTIPTGSTKILENFTGTSETGGMSINHSVICNHTDWLCGLSGVLDLPILYRTGSAIIEFALDESPNTRVNTNVTLNRDILKERLDRYEQKWRESLDNILQTMTVPSDSMCFECRSNVVHQSFAI